MARVSYGASVTKLRGSIGGTSFQTIGAADIARSRPNFRKSPSALEWESRSYFNLLVNAYAALTLTQKQAWVTFASANSKYNFWGEEKILNGYNWFLTINNYYYLYYGYILPSPPSYTSPEAVPAFSVTLSSSTIVADFGTTFTTSNFVQWFASPLLRSASMNNRKNLRFLGVSSGFSATSKDLTTLWVDKYGLSWPPSVSSVSLYIIIAAFTVNVTSFIPGSATMAIGSYS